MRLFSKWWKIHTAVLVALSLALAGCGGGSGDSAVDAGKGSGSSANNGIPNSIPDNSGINAGDSGSNSGSVVDNSNGNIMSTDTVKTVEMFVDTNNAIDDLALLDAGGVATFGKKAKGDKAYRGKASDLSKMWAVQYTSNGVIEKVYPMAKAGTKYSFSADLADSRDYKFVFLGYENGRWTGSVAENYTGPTEATSTIGSGSTNQLHGVDGVGASYLKVSEQAAVKASRNGIGNATGLKMTAKQGGIKGNDIMVETKEALRPTYFVGVIGYNGTNVTAGSRIRYRTVEGTQGNVNIKFQYHSNYVGKLQINHDDIVAARNDYLARAQDVDYNMHEYTAYDANTNTITVHYGPETTLNTVAFLLQGRNPTKIAFADVTTTGAVDQNLVDITTDTKLNPDDSKMNTNNGNLVASGNINGEASSIHFIPGTNTVEISYKNVGDSAGITTFYAAKISPTSAARPVNQAATAGVTDATLADIIQAYADADPSVRNLVTLELDTSAVGTTSFTSTHAASVAVTSRKLSGGVDASGNAMIQAFNKDTNPRFVWSDCLAIFTDNSALASSVLSLRSGSSITPHNPVAFHNLYRNFSYFGIYHLKGSEIITKKAKTSVEAKIVSAYSYRKEANIGPAVYKIENDTFTLGAGTGEVLLRIRNYYNSDVSLDDLRITASIRNAHLDSDSGKVSVALPIPTTGYTIPLPASTNVAPVLTQLGGVVDDDGNFLVHAIQAPETLLTFTRVNNPAPITTVFPAITDKNYTAIFADGDVNKQHFTLNKRSRSSLIRDFQWEEETTILLGTPVIVKSQQANTDTLIYDQDQDFTNASGGREIRGSFVSRTGTGAGNLGTYVANNKGEFVDINYGLYYRPRSAVGTDTILVFIEDGTKDPTGNLTGPRDSGLIATTDAGKIAETHSPAVGLDGTIIPYSGSNADLIYNTLSLEIPIDTIVIGGESNLEEPDAIVDFAIQFDAALGDGSTVGFSDSDPSTMAITTTLLNEKVGETYTYEWNWSGYQILEGDNNLIGMPDGGYLKGNGKHVLIFTDATGKHPEFASVKVTLRASTGLDPEGTVRPFDPSTFDPAEKVLVENVDRDYVFLANYDSGLDAVSMKAAGLKAACKLDLVSDPAEAHLIVTAKTNSAGELLASGNEISQAIRYYLAHSPIIDTLKATNSKFELLTVEGRGTTADQVPYWSTVRAIDADGVVLANGRVADDNAGPELSLHFKNSDDYLNVRDASAPILRVTIKDTVPTHNGTTYIVDLSNAYPPVVSAPSGTFNDIIYSFVTKAGDGLTDETNISGKKNKPNHEIFLSVEDVENNDPDGAVRLITRVKRLNAGINDSVMMQEKSKKVDDKEIGQPTDRSNQFVSYWDIRRVSDSSEQVLEGPGQDPTNKWVLASPVDFVGSGADGNANAVVYGSVYKAVHAAVMLDGAGTEAKAALLAQITAKAAHDGIDTVNMTALVAAINTEKGLGLTAVPISNAGNNALAAAGVVIQNRVEAATISASAALGLTVGATLSTSMTPAFADGAIAGKKALVYSTMYAEVGTWGTETLLTAHKLAKAAVIAYNRGIGDETYNTDEAAVYTDVYNAIYAASLADGDTVTEAKDRATAGAEAASFGADQTTVDAIVTNITHTGGGATADTAGGTKLDELRTNNITRLETALTTVVNTMDPEMIATNAAFIAEFTVGANSIGVNAAAMPAGSGAVGYRSNVYNWIITCGIAFGATNTYANLTKVAAATVDALGNLQEDWVNLIPEEAHKFNLGSKKDGGQHDATLDTLVNDDATTQHMKFNCRVIVPKSPAARDSYMLNFRFRPGVPMTSTVGSSPILTNSFIVTVTQ